MSGAFPRAAQECRPNKHTVFMPLSGSSTGKEATGARPLPRNLASIRTDHPVINPDLYHLRGYPGHQANRNPWLSPRVIAIGKGFPDLAPQALVTSLRAFGSRFIQATHMRTSTRRYAWPAMARFPYAALRSTFFNGIWRTRLPVAAKIALSTAGAATAMVGSPMPPQKPPEGMTMASTSGISSISIEG